MSTSAAPEPLTAALRRPSYVWAGYEKPSTSAPQLSSFAGRKDQLERIADALERIAAALEDMS